MRGAKAGGSPPWRSPLVYTGVHIYTIPPDNISPLFFTLEEQNSNTSLVIENNSNRAIIGSPRATSSSGVWYLQGSTPSSSQSYCRVQNRNVPAVCNGLETKTLARCSATLKLLHWRGSPARKDLMVNLLDCHTSNVDNM